MPVRPFCAAMAASAAVLLLGAAPAPAAASSPLLPPAATVAGAGFALTTTTTPDGRRVTNRWNPCQPRIAYRVNPALAGGSGATRAAAVRDVVTAVALLGRATGMRFQYLGTTTFVPTRDWARRMLDAEIVVAWVDPRRHPAGAVLLGGDRHGRAAGTGGFASSSWSSGGPWSSVIGRGYVVVNADQAASFRNGFGSGVTRGNLLLHELGHVVGLAHVSSPQQLMYATILPRTRAGYRSGDLAGLARVGVRAGCIDVPDGVWRDL